jgi:PAS domain S-box-containing protein
MVPERDLNGKVVGVLTIGRDITERKRMEDALRASEAELRMLVEYSPVSMLVCVWANGEEQIVMMNQRFTELFGYTSEDIHDMHHWWSLACQDEQYRGKNMLEWRERIEKAIQSHSDIEPMEIEVTGKDGASLYVKISLASIGDKNIITFEDLTQRNRAVAALLDFTENLEKIVTMRTVDFERAKLEAERANHAKSDFLATMSHEIRTPMNGVIGMVDVLRQTHLSDQQIEITDIIHDSAFALLAIVDDILDFSKIEAGKFNIDIVPMNVNKVVEDVCETLAQVAKNKAVELTLFTDPDIPEKVLGDPTRLRQILINLVGNAIKFSSQQGKQGVVSVRAVLSKSTAERVMLEFSVLDNGIGIDKGTQARLFTPFTQADSGTTRSFGGTGLGLAISRQLATLMGGEITVQSELGKGSLLTVRILFALEAEEHNTELVSPDMRLVFGLFCLVVGVEKSLADDLATYLEHGDAIIERVPDIATAQKWIIRQALDRYLPALCIVIIDIQGINPPLDELRATVRTRPGLNGRFILVGRGRRHSVHIEDADLITLDADGMHRIRFLEAVSIAAGRTLEYKVESQAGNVEIIAKPLTREETRQQGRLILVAEDNDINQKVILQQLTLLGQVADIAENGRRALERWQSGEYGILLTDLHMPEMDGYELTAAIRAAETDNTHIPIIALTANALSGEAEHCFALGMDDYLSKPLQLVNLKAVLGKWLPDAVLPVKALSPRILPAVAPDLTTPVDINVLVTLIGVADDATIRDFLHDFQLSLEKIAIELRAAYAASQYAAIGQLGHKLKSSARAVGALVLGELCAGMEKAGKAGDVSALMALLPEFELERARVVDFINGY